MAREPEGRRDPGDDLDPDEVGRLLEELDGLPEEELEAALEVRTAGRPHLADELRSLLSVARSAEVLFDRLAPSGEWPRSASPALADPGLTPGTRVGRYVVEGRLGSGGVGVVYRARDEVLRRPVALKVVPTLHEASSPGSVGGSGEERFLREARAVASLDHPGICTVHEVGTLDGGWSFLAMTLYEGETLQERLRRGPVPWFEAAKVAHGLAEGLVAAHERGIVHRDVKPGNVMLTRTGRVKLLDFGLARTADAALTLTGLTPGTVAYMSPEQVRGEEAGPASDLWSLGVVLHEMVAGAHPFAAWPGLEVVRAIATVTPPPLAELDPAVPGELSRLVGRLLARDASDRPGGREVREVLAALRERGRDRSGGTAAEPLRPGPSPGGAHPPDRPRSRGVAALALLAGAVLVGTCAVRVGDPFGSAPPVDPAVVAVVPFRVAASEPTLAYLEEGMVDLLATRLGDEERLRAVDPRAILHAWEEAGGKEAPEEALTEVARRFGAGRMVVGEVVGLAEEVSLTARLHLLDEERTEPTVTVTGPLDSLPALVDRLAGTLLSVEAGEGHRLASLTTGSLEALRAYLDGRVAFRQGRYDDATEAFLRATEADTTFALAALRLAEVALLASRPQHDGLLRAWRHRDRLGAADRAYLEAVAGPDFPERTPPDEAFAALERLVAYQPDSPEAWFWMGQRLVHRLVGSGTPDSVAIRRTGAPFERGLELDPAFQPARLQLLLTLLALGDTARANPMARRYLQAEDEGLSAEMLRCYLALQGGELDALPAVLARADSVQGSAQYGVSRCLTHFHNWDPGWAPVRDALMDSLGARIGDPGFLERNGRILMNLSLDRGRPTDAARYARALREAGLLRPLEQAAQELRHALWWEGERTGLERAEQVLSAWLDGGTGDPLELLEPAEAETACALGAWWVADGRAEAARELVGRLREGAERSDSWQAVAGRHCAELLEVWIEVERSGSPARLAGVDSLVSRMAGGVLRRETGLVLARLFEDQGELPRAREMLQRSGLTNPPVYLSTFDREKGRLAALAGDRREALHEWRGYLGLRSAPEPALAPEVERIREAVARLEAGADPAEVGASVRRAHPAGPDRPPGQPAAWEEPLR